MHKNPLISVIVTTFNRKEFLKKTLNSILSQTYSNLEILVIDDGSSDNTHSVVEKFSDNRLQFHTIKHSGRPAVPRNYGIKKSKGNFIAFCDDDDIWEADKISLQIKAFQDNPSIKLCYTNSSYIDENDLVLSFPYNSSKDKITTFKDQLYQNKVTFSSLMIHRDVVQAGHYFDERLSLKASEDFLFITKIVAKYPIYYLNLPLIKYRVHQNGISHNRTNIKKLVIYYFRLTRCFYNLLKEDYISIIKFFHLSCYHFIQVNKQISYLLLQRFKTFLRNANV
ncbi:MAG: glycosyltransferase [Proteobacteria bacterium]|nr:glycosyltransferase [Pseudomonadota bacterium]